MPPKRILDCDNPRGPKRQRNENDDSQKPAGNGSQEAIQGPGARDLLLIPELVTAIAEQLVVPNETETDFDPYFRADVDSLKSFRLTNRLFSECGAMLLFRTVRILGGKALLQNPRASVAIFRAITREPIASLIRSLEFRIDPVRDMQWLQDAHGNYDWARMVQYMDGTVLKVLVRHLVVEYDPLNVEVFGLMIRMLGQIFVRVNELELVAKSRPNQPLPMGSALSDPGERGLGMIRGLTTLRLTKFRNYLRNASSENFEDACADMVQYARDIIRHTGVNLKNLSIKGWTVAFLDQELFRLPDPPISCLHNLQTLELDSVRISGEALSGVLLNNAHTLKRVSLFDVALTSRFWYEFLEFFNSADFREVFVTADELGYWLRESTMNIWPESFVEGCANSTDFFGIHVMSLNIRDRIAYRSFVARTKPRAKPEDVFACGYARCAGKTKQNERCRNMSYTLFDEESRFWVHRNDSTPIDTMFFCRHHNQDDQVQRLVNWPWGE